MGCIKNLIFRMKKGFLCTPFVVIAEEVLVPFITMSSTSVLANWSPQTIINTGTTLDWTVSGGVTIAKTTINYPTFNFSGNSGIANILVENVEGLTRLGCYQNSLTTLDVSKSTALEYLYIPLNFLTTLDLGINTVLATLSCYENSLTVLDISANTALTLLRCYNNTISVLDVSANTALTELACFGNNQAPSVTDQIFIDLDTNAQINGLLQIRNNRTSASDTARANLITKGWSIYDTYTT